jgi:Flp pilus assembly pilin Flp
MKRLFLKAQSLIEYSVLIIVIAAALLSSQAYVKRALQGRWKQAMDNVGEQYDYASTFGDIYLYTQSNTVSTSHLINNEVGEGWLSRVDVTNSVENRIGAETVAGY